MADLFTYKTDTPSVYTSQSPLRVLDTRTNGGKLGAGGTYVLKLGGISVPANATAVVINLTATNTTAPSFFTVYLPYRCCTRTGSVAAMSRSCQVLV